MQFRTSILVIFSGIVLFTQSHGLSQEGQRNFFDVSLDSLLDVKISSASKYEQTASQAPASVTIITAEDIERYGYQTLDEVLMSVRGFYISNDRNYAYVGVRGFGRPTDYNNRILLLINGHSMNENVYGSALIGSEFGLSLNMIERIEIVRGPGSALYGTNAMFAVMNIITKKGSTVDGLKVTAEIGSYGSRQSTIRLGQEFDNGMEVFLSAMFSDVKGQDLYFQEYDGPSTNDGFATGLDWDKPRGIFATMKTGEFTFQGGISSREKGIPTGSYMTVFNDPASKTYDERAFLESKYDHDFDADKNVMMRVFFDRYYYGGTYPYTDDLQFDATNNHVVGSELQLRWDIRSNNRLIIGTEYRNNYSADYRLWNNTFSYFDQNFPFFNVTMYLQDEFQVREDLALLFGLHWDKYSTVEGVVTPRGAVIYNPFHSSTLKLLYGEAYRTPNVYEMHYEDSLAGMKANPDLQPERIRTVEVILEQRLSKGLSGSISIYENSMSNLIDPSMDLIDSLLVFKNIGEVKGIGMEFELNLRHNSGMSGYASYAIQRSENAITGQHLTNSPSHLGRLGIVYPFLQHFSLGVQFNYESERTTVYGSTTDPVFLTSLNFLIKPQLKSENNISKVLNHLQCSLHLRNLFDAGYETPGGLEHQQPAIAQNRRNMSIKLQYRL